ncbi:MAG TPA: hypothetical protein PK069_08140 [Methanolinea sp.]|nr:hypothetical protein [Methanolinea sp.]HQK56334.1 hypothetical protein [Methanolinea sp.]
MVKILVFHNVNPIMLYDIDRNNAGDGGIIKGCKFETMIPHESEDKRGMGKQTGLSEPQSREGRPCPVFGVESGGPIIGLGLLIILFGVFPLISGSYRTLPLPISLLFIGFGIYLIVLGIRK